MQNNLFLRRLVVFTDDGKTAYDETFHLGVNIIRGHNSSGKSTIIRFIFFVLGGCYSEFTPEALRCSSVVAEVEINGRVLVLKRYLEKRSDGRVNPYTPMYIHFGPITDVVSCFKFQDSSPENSNLKPEPREQRVQSQACLSYAESRPRKTEGQTLNLKPGTWSKFPYKSTTEHRSFSNVLFEVMGLPEIKTDSNITMHQILRLIYLDQESPLSSIFLFETFDREIMREAVANLLMGLYDGRLSRARLDKEALEKEIDEVSRAKKVTEEILSNPDTQSTLFLRSQIDRLQGEIAEITETVKRLREGEALSKLKSREYQRLQDEITRQRKTCDDLDAKVLRLKNDIQDTAYFIEILSHKREAIEHSLHTRDYFDTHHLDFCPECLTRLDTVVEEGHCPLCKSPIDNSRGKTQATRIRLELDFQIRQAETVQKINARKLEDMQAQLRSSKRQLSTAQKQYDAAVSNVRSTQDEKIDELLQTKGYKEGEIAQFNTLMEYADKYERLRQKLTVLEERHSELSRFIKAEEKRIEREQEKINHAISANGLFLLNNDDVRQDEFVSASDFKIDYKQNQAYISNQRYKLSASSAFYLKMAARFALFFASLQVDSMLYPRFMISDNMEDKGMEENRAKNFQRIIVQRLKELETRRRKNLKPEPREQREQSQACLSYAESRPRKTEGQTLNLKLENQPDFQLIFATSNIADELDTPEYTIGEKYSPTNKSLKNV